MTRKALIERELKRAKLASKYAAKRSMLMEVIHDSTKTDEQKFGARLELQKIPRNASLTRKRNRCALTGRPRGTFRKFGLGRNKLRELALSGQIPGIIKVSW